MKNAKLCVVTVLFLIFTAVSVSAQQKKKPAPVKKSPVVTTPAKTPAKTGTSTAKTPAATKTPAGKEEKRDEKEDQAKVKDMIAFLEFMLNTLGSSTTSARDKEVLITQSYSKVFRDGKVQVEDDLDADRNVTTNKDIVAYLKDVDFFFKDVKFEFVIDEIKTGINGIEKTFYKVSIKRNLKGTTTDGVAVNNTIPRYIEVNYDADAQDLKIVSIYTHEINEKDALINWWKELSLAWKGIFKKKLNLNSDSLSYSDIRAIAAITDLNLAGNDVIQDIEPLSRLVRLQNLSIESTDINDISPLRNLTELADINLSNTTITDLTPLKYCDKVQRLNLRHTGVNDLSVLQKMPLLQWLNASFTPVSDLSALTGATALQYLNIAHTKVIDFTPIQALSQLSELVMSGTTISDLSVISGNKSLVTLTIDSTAVSTLSAAASLENVKIINANGTRISDLKALYKLTHLERVYADHTPIRKETADAFAAANSKVLVIYNSDDLKSWWDALSPAWQEILSKTAQIAASPTKEELARVPSVDSINVSGNASVRDLEPLRKLVKLRALKADRTSISDLEPLRDHIEIESLDISETAVSDLGVLRQLTRLQLLRADRSKVQSIAPLNNLVSLQRVYVDETEVHDITAREFLEKNHSCLLVYKTIHLNRWWKKISSDWKSGLRAAMGADTTSTRENLHKLVELETLALKDAGIGDLTPLSEFVRLRNLEFSGTAVTDLAPLATMKTLRSLHATNGPLQKIDVLQQLTDLEDLDISNTPIDELRYVGVLENLTRFSCAGTQIKRLDPLDKVQHLDYLDCSNTKVGNLDGVSYLPLKTLKCYNTKISTRQIDNFKKSNAGCNVIYYR